MAAAKNWSDWAFIYRYPSDEALPEPDEDELRRALEVIDRLAARLRAANPEPPVDPSRRTPTPRSTR